MNEAKNPMDAANKILAIARDNAKPLKELDVILTAPCGCRMVRDVGTSVCRLEMCPLHGAATEMYEALEEAISEVVIECETTSGLMADEKYHFVDKARAILAKAQGET